MDGIDLSSTFLTANLNYPFYFSSEVNSTHVALDTKAMLGGDVYQQKFDTAAVSPSQLGCPKPNAVTTSRHDRSLGFIIDLTY